MNQGTLDQLNDKYEYKVIMDTDSTVDETYINDLGKQGWELTFLINSNLGRDHDRYYFRRFRGA